MRHILVTGANKGIGLALVQAILDEHADTRVFLGSRSLERGRSAAASLASEHPTWSERLEVVALDVADERSVAEAARHVGEKLRGEKLYAIVNNAGIGGPEHPLAAVLDTNVLGIQRVCEAFLPLLEARGRIVNVTSAAGPSFVAACSPEWQAFFCDEQLAWSRLNTFVGECRAATPQALVAKGLADGGAYGLSKACANSLTLILAREHAGLVVNACTPGFIETDLSRHYAVASGKTPAELGMKSPAEGTKAPLHLLFADLPASGRYYGSDARRSPLDRYRAPGSPEHEPSR